MAKHATVVTNSNTTNTVAPQAIVAPYETLRARRIARVQVALYARNRAAKQQAHVTATLVHKQQAYMLAVHELAVQYGLDPAQNTVAVRSVHAVQQHAPSAQAGACKLVHALCVQHNGVRSAVLAGCKAAGINPATAATQYQKWRKANAA